MMFNKKLHARIAELESENERLLSMIADPQLISVAVEERAVEIAVRPREEIMRHLFLMLAHGLGESKNFVECTFGPDEEGRRYVVTLQNSLGKTPAELAIDRESKLLEERNQALAEIGRIGHENGTLQAELEEAKRREEIIRDPAQTFVDWVLGGYEPPGIGGKLVRALRDGLNGIVSNGDEPIKYGYPNTCPWCNADAGWLETLPPTCAACKYVEGEYP